MAQIDQTTNDDKLICWARGDSSARGFTIKDSSVSPSVPIDITGFSFKLTVNSEKDPTNQTNEIFSVVGTIVDGPNGKVSFAPSSTETNVAPGPYYYDIEQTDLGGLISTLIKGKCKIIQDITKV